MHNTSPGQGGIPPNQWSISYTFTNAVLKMVKLLLELLDSTEIQRVRLINMNQLLLESCEHQIKMINNGMTIVQKSSNYIDMHNLGYIKWVWSTPPRYSRNICGWYSKIYNFVKVRLSHSGTNKFSESEWVQVLIPPCKWVHGHHPSSAFSFQSQIQI